MSIEDRDYFREDSAARQRGAQNFPKVYRDPAGSARRRPSGPPKSDSSLLRITFALLALGVTLAAIQSWRDRARLAEAQPYRAAPAASAPSLKATEVANPRGPEPSELNVLLAGVRGAIGQVAPVRPELQVFPTTGTVRYFQPVDRNQLTGRLTLASTEGHVYNLVARVTSLDTNTAFVDVYLHPGDVTEIWLPRGHFQVDALFGQAWRGADKLFADGRPISGEPYRFVVSPGTSHSEVFRFGPTVHQVN